MSTFVWGSSPAVLMNNEIASLPAGEGLWQEIPDLWMALRHGRILFQINVNDHYACGLDFDLERLFHGDLLIIEIDLLARSGVHISGRKDGELAYDPRIGDLSLIFWGDNCYNYIVAYIFFFVFDILLFVYHFLW